MAVDLTGLYWDLIIASGCSQGLTKEDLKKLRSAQLLRSLASKNEFTKAVAEVGQNIATLRQYLTENQQRYVQQGRLAENERDSIEQELHAYVKACSTNISRLQSIINTIPAASPIKTNLPLSNDYVAHRQGMILILSERLSTLTSAFDRLRSIRYKQLEREEANRRRRTPTITGMSRRGDNDGIAAALLQNGPRGSLTAAFNSVASDRNPASLLHADQQQAQQQQQGFVDQENLALQAELLSLTDQVQKAEQTVKEIATLNQMFSTAILHQSEQIEKLYNEAVAATGNIGKANVQLDKAIKANRSAQKCMFVLLLMASLGLLFLDWWYS